MGHTVPLFPIRESSDPSNIIEPSFDPVNQRVESENQPNEVSNVPSQNMCILSLITQQLLLMTPPGLHTNHLISNYCSEKLISYLIFLFSFLYCVFAISWTFKKSSKNENLIKMMDLLVQKSRYLLNIFFDLGFLLVIFWRDIWEIKPFQHKHFQLNTIFSEQLKKILVRLNILIFESFHTKNILILFLVNILIPNGTNFSRKICKSN